MENSKEDSSDDCQLAIVTDNSDFEEDYENKQFFGDVEDEMCKNKLCIQGDSKDNGYMNMICDNLKDNGYEDKHITSDNSNASLTHLSQDGLKTKNLYKDNKIDNNILIEALGNHKIEDLINPEVDPTLETCDDDELMKLYNEKAKLIKEVEKALKDELLGNNDLHTNELNSLQTHNNYEEIKSENGFLSQNNYGNSTINKDNDVESSEDYEQCPICLIQFMDQEIASPNNCHHSYCLECLIEWSKNVTTCPIDRISFQFIYARHSYEGTIFKKIPVQDKNDHRDLEDGEEVLEMTLCQICNLGDREESLLLCDICDNGYHMECLTPPLSHVPIEEWYCPDCDSNNNGTVEESDEETVHGICLNKDCYLNLKEFPPCIIYSGKRNQMESKEFLDEFARLATTSDNSSSATEEGDGSSAQTEDRAALRSYLSKTRDGRPRLPVPSIPRTRASERVRARIIKNRQRKISQQDSGSTENEPGPSSFSTARVARPASSAVPYLDMGELLEALMRRRRKAATLKLKSGSDGGGARFVKRNFSKNGWRRKGRRRKRKAARKKGRRHRVKGASRGKKKKVKKRNSETVRVVGEDGGETDGNDNSRYTTTKSSHQRHHPNDESLRLERRRKKERFSIKGGSLSPLFTPSPSHSPPPTDIGDFKENTDPGKRSALTPDLRHRHRQLSSRSDNINDKPYDMGPSNDKTRDAKPGGDLLGSIFDDQAKMLKISYNTKHVRVDSDGSLRYGDKTKTSAGKSIPPTALLIPASTIHRPPSRVYSRGLNKSSKDKISNYEREKSGRDSKKYPSASSNIESQNETFDKYCDVNKFPQYHGKGENRLVDFGGLPDHRTSKVVEERMVGNPKVYHHSRTLAKTPDKDNNYSSTHLNRKNSRHLVDENPITSHKRSKSHEKRTKVVPPKARVSSSKCELQAETRAKGHRVNKVSSSLTRPKRSSPSSPIDSGDSKSIVSASRLSKTGEEDRVSGVKPRHISRIKDDDAKLGITAPRRHHDGQRDKDLRGSVTKIKGNSCIHAIRSAASRALEEEEMATPFPKDSFKSMYKRDLFISYLYIFPVHIKLETVYPDPFYPNTTPDYTDVAKSNAKSTITRGLPNYHSTDQEPSVVPRGLSREIRHRTPGKVDDSSKKYKRGRTAGVLDNKDSYDETCSKNGPINKGHRRESSRSKSRRSSPHISGKSRERRDKNHQPISKDHGREGRHEVHSSRDRQTAHSIKRIPSSHGKEVRQSKSGRSHTNAGTEKRDHGASLERRGESKLSNPAPGRKNSDKTRKTTSHPDHQTGSESCHIRGSGDGSKNDRYRKSKYDSGEDDDLEIIRVLDYTKNKRDEAKNRIEVITLEGDDVDDNGLGGGYESSGCDKGVIIRATQGAVSVMAPPPLPMIASPLCCHIPLPYDPSDPTPVSPLLQDSPASPKMATTLTISPLLPPPIPCFLPPPPAFLIAAQQSRPRTTLNSVPGINHPSLGSRDNYPFAPTQQFHSDLPPPFLSPKLAHHPSSQTYPEDALGIPDSEIDSFNTTTSYNQNYGQDLLRSTNIPMPPPSFPSHPPPPPHQILTRDVNSGPHPVSAPLPKSVRTTLTLKNSKPRGARPLAPSVFASSDDENESSLFLPHKSYFETSPPISLLGPVPINNSELPPHVNPPTTGPLVKESQRDIVASETLLPAFMDTTATEDKSASVNITKVIDILSSATKIKGAPNNSVTKEKTLVSSDFNSTIEEISRIILKAPTPNKKREKDKPAHESKHKDNSSHRDKKHRSGEKCDTGHDHKRKRKSKEKAAQEGKRRGRDASPKRKRSKLSSSHHAPEGKSHASKSHAFYRGADKKIPGSDRVVPRSSSNHDKKSGAEAQAKRTGERRDKRDKSPPPSVVDKSFGKRGKGRRKSPQSISPPQNTPRRNRHRQVGGVGEEDDQSQAISSTLLSLVGSCNAPVPPTKAKRSIVMSSSTPRKPSITPVQKPDFEADRRTRVPEGGAPDPEPRTTPVPHPTTDAVTKRDLFNLPRFYLPPEPSVSEGDDDAAAPTDPNHRGEVGEPVGVKEGKLIIHTGRVSPRNQDYRDKVGREGGGDSVPAYDYDKVFGGSADDSVSEYDLDLNGGDMGGQNSMGRDSPNEPADEIPNSAMDMIRRDKYFQKINHQQRVAEEVKVCLKPFFTRGDITKQQYKDIMRRAVTKICRSKGGKIKPLKILTLVQAYVKIYQKQ